MGIFVGLILFFSVIQFCFCQCKKTPFKFVPLVPVLGLFLWIEMNRAPGPNCGVGMEVEIVLIGACVIGIVFGWIIYGAKAAFHKEG